MNKRISVNAMAMLDLPVEEEAETLASLGVRRVGLASRKLAEQGWERGLEAVSASGLEIAYLVHGVFTPVDDTAGWLDELELFLKAIDTAAQVGAPFVYFCSGPAGSLRWETAADALGERLAPAIERGSACGVKLAIENGSPLWTQCSFVFSLRDAVNLARRIGITVCADLYGCWIEPDLAGTLREAVDLIALVQLSDRELTSLAEPDRRVLGDGDLPLDRLIGDVLDSGYQGLFDVEIFGPRIDSEGPAEAVRRSIAWLDAALARLEGGRQIPD